MIPPAPPAADIIFQHTFKNGITGVFAFNRLIHFDPASNHIQPLKRLSRAPTDDEAPAMLPEYRQWVHLVNAEIAKSIGGPCLYILADSQSEPPLAEWWLYEPGSPPELLPSTAPI